MSAIAAGAATTVTGAVPHTGAVRPLSLGRERVHSRSGVTAGAGAMVGAAVYGNPVRMSVREDDPTVPTSPYGSSKLMTEIMLRDAEAAHGLRYMILRYFNVTGADPLGRTGQSTRGATHLIKIAVETALGLRPMLSVFGTDYRTPDGTWIRDYIHMSDLIAVHCDALAYLRAVGASTTINCGYGHGFSDGVDFKVEFAGRREGDPTQIVAACDRVRATLNWQPRFDDLIWKPSSLTLWHGSASFRNAPADRNPSHST